MMSSSTPPSPLLHLFEATISPHQETRQSAEKNLSLLANQPGFLPSLLSIITNPSSSAQQQKATAIFFKNEVEKRWSGEGRADDSITSEDRMAVKQAIVPGLVAACSGTLGCVSLLKAAIHRIVRNDFPKQWESLLEQISPLLSHSNPAYLEAGLIVLHEVIAWKGYDDDHVSHHIYNTFVPQLLVIAQAALPQASQSEAAAKLLKAVLKSIYSCIAYKYNPAVLGENSAVAWCTLITQTVQLQVPDSIANLPDDETRAETALWKAKKWAFHCQLRIFTRHGCPDGSSYQAPSVASNTQWSFSRFYMANMALPILNVNLELIKSSRLTDRVFCLMCDYLSEVNRSKKLLQVILPHLPDILSQFSFPQLCFSEQDQELWEDDPLEYCRCMLDPFDDYLSAQSCAANLFLDLCKTRKKHVFPIVLQLISQIMSSQATDDTSIRRKDGCLFLIGTLSKVLIKNGMEEQVESMLTHHILPILTSHSSQGYLRVRGFWTVQQFSELNFKNQQTVLELLRAILAGLQDAANLPVQVQAACTLGDLIDQAAVQAALPQILAPVVEAVLSLNSKVEVDSLAMVLERLVSMFAEELAPFANQLCSSVRDTAIRIVKQQIDAGSVDAKTGGVEFEESDRMMALVGMMRTLITLVDSMADSQSLLCSLEDILSPLLLFILEHRVSDVYEEVFELLESFTYLRKATSPHSWKAVEFIVLRLYKDTDLDYLEEIANLIDNCVTYDPATFASHPPLQQAVCEIVQRVLGSSSDEYSYGQETQAVCAMINAILLSCGSSVSALIPLFVSLTMKRILEEQCDTDVDTIINLEATLCSLIASPQAALAALSPAFTQVFIAKLSLLSAKFKRVHDKQLIIAAMSALLRQSELPASLAAHLPLLLTVYSEAISTLPGAMAERKKLQEDADNSEDDMDNDYNYDSDDYEDLDAIEEQASSEQDVSQAGPDNDNDDDEEYGEEDEWEEDGLEEDIYYETALDKADFAGMVQSSLQHFARSQTALFQKGLHDLSEEHQKLLLTIVQ